MFVIFTKYDKLIGKHREDWQENNSGTSTLSWDQSFALAEDPAFTDYEENYKNAILEMTKRKPSVKICRVAIRKGVDYKLQKYNRQGTYPLQYFREKSC